MFYIIGLGNPGEKYHHSRHNVGWLMVDSFVEHCGLPGFVASSKYAGDVSEGVISGTEVSILKPNTYMNKSGSAVRKLVPNGEEGNVIVVYDDIDLPLGELKVSVGRGDGGHNGIKSLVSSLGTKNFVRVRVGIAEPTFWPWEKGETRRPKGAALPRFVLKDFKKKEMDAITKVGKVVTECLKTILTGGVEKAMNQYN